MENNNIFEAFKPLLNEAYQRRVWVITAFTVISVIALVLGLKWPKVYESYATVFVQERNILGRLMEGAAVQTDIEDRARIAREIIYGRTLLTKVLEETGQIDSDITPKDLEASITNIRLRTSISNVGGKNTNLIKVANVSYDPEMAFLTTQLLAELFIAESSAEKERESQSAYQFIESQVQAYERKLKISEGQLKEFRAANQAVTPGAEADLRRRIDRLRTAIANNEQLLRESTIKERSLQAQLAGESDSAVSVSKAQQLRQRKAELRQNLDALRLNYLDTYPDVIRLRSQIEEIDKLIGEAEGGRSVAGSAGQESRPDGIVVQQLKSDLYLTRTEIKTLRSRLEESRSELSQALVEAMAIPDAEAQLAELTREYEVTKGIYEDLLRRREIARVSMNLDLEKQGLTLRIDEPAFYPYHPTGPRFWHFALAGFVLGWLIPLGIIFGLQMMRPKLRLLPHIPERTGLPVLGSIPHMVTPREVRVGQVVDWVALSLLVVTIAVIAVVASLRYQGLI